jgi:NitT/TauT family transport system ATP-binding protein
MTRHNDVAASYGVLDADQPAAATATATLAVSAQRASFAYNEKVLAVKDFTLDFPRGTFTAIVGPSGCGKSTLLQLFTGLKSPTSGTITRSMGPARKRGSGPPMTMVFQQDTLLPWRTVAENVAIAGLFDKKIRPELRERALERLEDLKLRDFADAFPHELSGGMRRRVAFLAGVVSQPEVLLLDEPFSSVDEPTRVSIHQDVHRVVRSTGTTTILVTHDLAEAVTLADRVVILTRRPASVAEIVDVPFGNDRDVAHLRQDPKFLELYGRLWASLQTQVEAA